jgi:hypothetical protein
MILLSSKSLDNLYTQLDFPSGISMIFYISVGHDSTIYVANTVGTLCSVEDETGNISLITSPESGNSMGKLVMDTSGNVSNSSYVLMYD